MSSVWTVTKTKGSPIEIPKGIADEDTIEICGDHLEDRTPEGEPARSGCIPINYDDFGVITTYEGAYYHLVFKNGQTEIRGAFTGSHLLSLDAPDAVEIGANAFSESRRLEELHLPSLRSIGAWAFQHCPRLKPFRITRDVEHIGDGAFAGCELIKSFDVDPDNEHYESAGAALYRKADGDGGRRTLVARAAGCADACIEVDGDIGERAFAGAMHLEEISLIDAVSIGHLAFAQCNALRRICLPATLTEFPLTAFLVMPAFGDYGKMSLTAFEVDPNNPRIASRDGVLHSKDMKELLAYPQARSDDEFFDEDVEVVREDAFYCCHAVKRVSLPNVRRVEVGAFYRCGQLISISLPSLEEIALDPDFKSARAIDMCPTRLIRIGKEPPTNAGYLVSSSTVDADMHYVTARVIVPDLSRYANCKDDERPIADLVELPKDEMLWVDEPLKSVFRVFIGNMVFGDISKRVSQLNDIADNMLDSGVLTDPSATLRNRRLKRHRMRKFINKTQIFLRELRTLLPDAYAEIDLTVEHNWIWEHNWGDDPCFVNVAPPRGCSHDRPYWEIRLEMEISATSPELKGSARAWICGSMVQEHIRDDLSWLWEELGKTDFERHVHVADDGLSWDIDEVIA